VRPYNVRLNVGAHCCAPVRVVLRKSRVRLNHGVLFEMETQTKIGALDEVKRQREEKPSVESTPE